MTKEFYREYLEAPRRKAQLVRANVRLVAHLCVLTGRVLAHAAVRDEPEQVVRAGLLVAKASPRQGDCLQR